MEVNFPLDLETKLNRLAVEQGRKPETLVHEAVERLVGDDEWFVREVEKGLARVERGEVVEHEEIGKRMERLLSRKRTGA